METIAAAAIRYDNTIYSLPPPARHHNICHLMSDKGLGAETMRDQGFITNTDRFVSREEACVIATNAGQIIKKTNPKHLLFSEDVW